MVVVSCMLGAGCAQPGASGSTPDGGQQRAREETTADAGSGPRAPRDVSVEEVGSCDAREAALAPSTRCEELGVSCEGLSPTRVQLAITEPPAGVAVRGVLVFGEGGSGNEFTASGRATDGALRYRDAMRRLVLQGYIVVDRRWVDGWFGQRGLGIGTPSCRYASLIGHLSRTIARGRPLCAAGNSGGSSEVAYSLTRWNGAELLSLVSLSGGPPMARLDVGCFGDEALPGWRGRCEQEWARTQNECPRSVVPACTLRDRASAAAPGLVDSAYATEADATPCTRGSAETGRRLGDDSIASPSARFDFPSTRVRFLVGRMDCTEAPILGVLFRERITSAVEERVVSGLRHPVAATQAGVDAVADALADCAP